MDRSLSGVKVVDLAGGLSPALVARLLAGMGAEVRRFEPTAGDPFHGLYAGYGSLHADAVTALVDNVGDDAVLAALSRADVALVGGEDFPGTDWRARAEALALAYPDLIILDIAAYPDGYEGKAVDLLVQARSGICYEQYTDRPLRAGFEAASYGAALQGLLALLGAIYGGGGQIVRASYYEGALTWALPFWSTARRASESFYFALPKDPVPLIFRCRDGRFIHFVMGSVGAKPKVYRVLGIDDPTLDPMDRGQPTGEGDPRKIFGDVDLLAAHVEKIDSVQLLADLQREGVAAELVGAPGECWDDPQVRHCGLIDTQADGSARVGLPFAGVIAPRGSSPVHSGVGEAGPLAGVRVLDFGLFVGGPYGSLCLADLGAEVIKVEPLTGDPNRTIFKSFISINRGKRSIAIDMKPREGREIIAKLCESALVLVSNFRPGVTHRLGIDPQTTHQTDPNKVVLEVSGYGRDGPKGTLAGWDMVFQALCGLELRGGGVDNMPLWARSTMVDYATGLLDAIAVVAALIAQRNGAGGADLETSLLASGVFLQSELVRAADGKFSGAPLLNNAQTGFHPAEAFYQASDGWIAIAARSEAMAAALAEMLGLELPARANWGEAEATLIGERIAKASAVEWLARCAATGVWAEPCVSDGDAFLEDPQRQPRAAVVTVTETIHGELRQPGALFRLSRGVAAPPPVIPRLGEHTTEILAELGYSQAHIERLRAAKIVH